MMKEDDNLPIVQCGEGTQKKTETQMLQKKMKEFMVPMDQSQIFDASS